METGGSSGAPLGWYRTAQLPPPVSRAHRPWIRRERTLDALACLALSALCFSQASVETLFRTDRDFYNRLLLGAPTLVAFILNVVGLAAATTLLFVLNASRVTYESLGRWTDAIGRPGLAALVVVVLAAALRWPRPSLRTIRRIAIVAAPLGVLTLAQALWMFLELAGGPVWRRVDPAPLNVSPPSLRRVVWLLFEELDQSLTFEARPAGLELPEFDRLRRESLYADAAHPPAGTTDVSMPALITGRPVVGVVPVSPIDLELTFADGKTALWSTQPNVFSRTRVFGYDTALVGWELPYPRVLGNALGIADWRPSPAYEQTRGETVSEALWNQWGSLAPPVHVRRLFGQRVAELGDRAIRIASDGRFGLVLLHLPLPQPPGIYDRVTGRLTPWNFTGAETEYLDNLALADRVVGELRRGLERARLLDRTWIVVSSDRWWRASKRPDGQVDHRVPFLVRSPEGDRTAHVDGAFSTLSTHDLILAILRGSIGDTDSAAAWLRRYPSAPPKDYTSLGRPIY